MYSRREDIDLQSRIVRLNGIYVSVKLTKNGSKHGTNHSKRNSQMMTFSHI